MKALWIALGAETLKLRRTLALAVAVLAPLVIAVFQLAMYLQHLDYYLPLPGENPWVQFSQIALVYWNLLMLPLFITLETALLAQLEHNGGNWKLIYTLSTSRWAIYAAKQLVAMGLVAFSVFVLLGLLVGVGKILQLIEPALGLDAAIPWGYIFKFAGLAYLASWLMISFHLWVGTRWNSFVLAAGVGITATILGVFVFGDDLAKYYPWTLPGTLALEMRDAGPIFTSLFLGCLGGLVLAFLGGRDVIRQDVC